MVPKKGGMIVICNEKNDLIPTRIVTEWRMCIDYHKLNDATRNDHFLLLFMDHMLERLVGQAFYCFLDCPFNVFAYRKMPFGLYNALATFQRCMLAIYVDLVEKCIEVFMDDFCLWLFL